MVLFLTGLISVIGLHLIPYFGIRFRSKIIARIGKGPYMGGFAVAVLAAFTALVFGWQATDPGFLYVPPTWGMHVTATATLFGFILFIASNAPTNLRRLIRHPQMTGVFLWSAGHLFSNGEIRSVLLFGGFALWAIVSILAANRRDQVWIMPEKQPLIKDIITVAIALTLFAGFIHFHEALIGVRPIP